MTFQLGRLVWFAGCLICASACNEPTGREPEHRPGGAGTGGTGSAAGAPAVRSGLPPEAVINELSEGELEQLCGSINDWYVALLGEEAISNYACLVDAARKASGTSGSGAPTLDVAACKQGVAQCQAAGGVAPPVLPCDSIALQASLASCRATVAEYETCTTASFSASAQDTEGASCESLAARLTNPMMQSQAAMAAAEVCAPFLERCPGR